MTEILQNDILPDSNFNKCDYRFSWRRIVMDVSSFFRNFSANWISCKDLVRSLAKVSLNIWRRWPATVSARCKLRLLSKRDRFTMIVYKQIRAHAEIKSMNFSLKNCLKAVKDFFFFFFFLVLSDSCHYVKSSVLSFTLLFFRLGSSLSSYFLILLWTCTRAETHNISTFRYVPCA